MLVLDLPENINHLWTCDWFTLLKNPICTQILSHGSLPNADLLVELEKQSQPELLTIAIAALQAFVQENFVGPKLDVNLYAELPFYAQLQSDASSLDFASRIGVDGEEVNVNVSRPELLCIAITILEHQLKSPSTLVDAHIVQWWYLRYLYVHQQLLDEPTDTLYTAFLKYSNQLLVWAEPDAESKTIMRLEIAQGLLAYRRTWKAVSHLDEAKRLLSADLEVTAFLGKRTKWQQKPLPQMALKITLGKSEALPAAGATHSSTSLPTLLQLDDDVRLEKITFESDEDNRTLALASLVQQLVLSIL